MMVVLQKKIRGRGNILKICLICVATFFGTSCTSEDESKFEFKYPVPSPAADPEPSPTEPAPSPEATPTQSPLPVDRDRFNIGGQPPATSSVNEGETTTAIFDVTSKLGLDVSFGYRCEFGCPIGMENLGSGRFSWTPNFSQSGLWDIVYVARDSEGYELATGMVRIRVINVNRPPKIQSVTVRRAKAGADTVYVCDVEKFDPDLDGVTVARGWYVNGQKVSADTYYLRRQDLPVRASLYCDAVARDDGALSSSVVQSEPLQLANQVPVASAPLVELLGASPLKVGGRLGCQADFFDADGDPLTAQKAVLILSRDGAVTSQIDLSAQLSSFGLSTRFFAEHVVTSGEAHQSLSCEFWVTDGIDVTTIQTESIFVENSAPEVTGVSLITDNPSLLTGETVKCEASFFDPDGDELYTEIGYFVATLPRGGGTDTETEANRKSSRYRLKTAREVSSAADRDSRSKPIFCQLKAIDPYSAVTVGQSSQIIISDSPPEIIFSNLSAALEQTVVTGQSTAAINWTIYDGDLDAATLVKSSDSCLERGIASPEDISSLNQLVLDPVPPAGFPAEARDCQISYRLGSVGRSWPGFTLSLSIPNRSPTIYCSPSSQLASPPDESFQFLPIGLGGLADPVHCFGSDPDGTTVFDFDVVSSGCSLRFSNIQDDSLSLESATFSANGELGQCQGAVTASDGEASSAAFVVSLSPVIVTNVSPTFGLDNRCELGASSSAALSSEYSYAPSLSEVAVDVASVPMFYRHRELSRYLVAVDESLLAARVGSTVTLGWTIAATLNQDESRVVKKQIFRQADVGLVSASNPASYLERVERTVGGANGTGRQTSSSLGCFQSSSCQSAAPELARASLAVGRDHLCYKGSDRLVYCIGSNELGQLGQPPATSSSSSGTVVVGLHQNISGTGGSRLVTEVVSGIAHSCALLDDGGVLCWGDNRYGQLGRGSSESVEFGAGAVVIKNESDQLEALAGIVSISSGDYHTCALSQSGQTYCWGSNRYGQLGAFSSILQPLSPQFVLSPPEQLCVDGDEVQQDQYQHCSRIGVRVDYGAGVEGEVVAETSAVYTGPHASCSMSSSSKVYCWGKNTNDQLAETGTSGQAIPQPVLVQSLAEPLMISMGEAQFCVSYSDTNVWCRGTGLSGELLTESTQTLRSYLAPASEKHYSLISFGREGACFIDEAQHVLCSGKGGAGQLGSGVEDLRFSFSEVLLADGTGVLPRAVAVSSRGNNFCAISDDTNIYCWGETVRSFYGDSLDLSYPTGVVDRAEPTLNLVAPSKRSCDSAYLLSPKSGVQ